MRRGGASLSLGRNNIPSMGGPQHYKIALWEGRKICYIGMGAH